MRPVRFLWALLALGLLVVLHELGHVLVARLLGLPVFRFKVGIGPALWERTIGQTRLVIAVLPVGGHAQIAGLSALAEPPDGIRVSAGRRAWLAAAGPIVNLLAAVLSLTALYAAGTHQPVPLTVGLVDPGSPAARAQLRPGDRLWTLDGKPLTEWGSVGSGLAPGRVVVLGVKRGADSFDVSLTATADARLGLHEQYVHTAWPLPKAFLGAVRRTGQLLIEVPTAGLALLAASPDTRLAESLAKQASDAASEGLDAFVRTFAALSVALTLYYLLPIPALDGGRLLLILVEKLRGKPLPAAPLAVLQIAGFVSLAVVLALFATRELRRSWPSGGEAAVREGIGQSGGGLGPAVGDGGNGEVVSAARPAEGPPAPNTPGERPELEADGSVAPGELAAGPDADGGEKWAGQGDAGLEAPALPAR